MSSNRAFAAAGSLGLATTLLTFALIVIGSVVRTTGSGLACPDWPLCQGQLIPPLESHVLIEWFHRLIALLVSLLVVATAAWTFSQGAVRARLGMLAILSVALLFAQVMLGALTVWKLLDPSIVSGHLAVALLLFATLITYTMTASAHGEEPSVSSTPRPAALLPWIAVATALTYLQALLGGVVSTHHAGLACPEWPTCNGEWFPPLDGLVGIQMLHRYGAYLLTLVLLVVATLSRTSANPGVRAGGQLALTLMVAQVVLGVCNVFLGTPVWLSAAHLATAVVLLAVLLATTFRVARLPRAIAEAHTPDPAVGEMAR